MTSETEDIGSHRMERPRILLVEDNPGDARLLEAHLEEAEFSCDLLTAGSLSEALTAVNEERPDLCLLDLGLPDSEGVETVERFRRRAGELPIIVLTGLDDLETATGAVRAGAEEYLVKDEITPRTLGRTLRFVLEREKVQQKYRAIFETTPTAVGIATLGDGKFIEVNPAFEKLLGRSRAEVVGSTASELDIWARPEQRDFVAERLKRHGSVQNLEAQFEDGDGNHVDVLFSGSLLKRAGEAYLVGVAQDVTKRVKSERALGERVKEQSCLYDITRILHEDEQSLGQRLQDLVDRIPPGWQYPEVTAARLRRDGESYTAGGFAEDDPRLTSELRVEGDRVGDLSVSYTEERPEEDIGPFLVEERRLLDEIAEQVEIELSRQKTRREIIHVVETMKEAVTIAAPDGTITFANSAARRLFGGEELDYVGEDLTDFAPQVRTLDGAPYPPEELPFQQVVRTGEPVTAFEHRIEKSDGTEIIVSVNAAPIEDEDGDLTGVVLSVRDITTQHRAEEWRHLLESSVEAAAHGIVLTDREGRIVWTNPAFTDMTGYTSEEVLGENPRILQSGEQDEVFYEEMWSTILVGETWEGEIVNQRKDGTLYTEWMTIESVRHRSDEITHFVAIKEDISEHKEREARYRTLVETMAEATVIMNPEGRITFANTEAERLLGLERSELADRTYDDPGWKITAPGGGLFPESELPFRRVMDTGEPVREVEHAITRPDGTRTILSVNAAPLDVEGGGGAGGVVATMRDVTEQKQLEKQLEHQAFHDPLTGLANRALFEDRLEQALARSRRREEPMGLLMLDIDAFKRINDSLGHTVGDDVLEQVARRLDDAVRDTDTVARWGGDEFVVVLPELETPEAIEDLQTRLRRAIEIPFEIGEERIEITVTVGGVVHTTEDVPGSVETQNPEDLARFADLALHRAKSRSPGGFYQFDPAEELDEIPDLRIEQDLRRGLEADEIEVFYQPIFRLEEGSVWGLEALARWRHPERGMVAPGEFIPLAERVGLIHELGDAVCQTSCRQVAAWNAEWGGHDDLKIAVNLSAHQLQDPDLTDRMRELMEGKNISPNQVVLEVTETAMMKTVGQARKFGALGVNLFIDDFGTGYSTFTYLRELDVQGVKLDMSLVQGLPDSQSDAAIVESMVTLANRLGIPVVAEGIETRAQLDTLRELGCHLGQGFLLGRPVPGAEIQGFLDGSSALPLDAGEASKGE